MKFILNRALTIGFNFLHRMAERESFSAFKPMLKECTNYRSDYKWSNACVRIMGCQSSTRVIKTIVWGI